MRDLYHALKHAAAQARTYAWAFVALLVILNLACVGLLFVAVADHASGATFLSLGIGGFSSGFAAAQIISTMD